TVCRGTAVLALAISFTGDRSKNHAVAPTALSVKPNVTTVPNWKTSCVIDSLLAFTCSKYSRSCYAVRIRNFKLFGKYVEFKTRGQSVNGTPTASNTNEFFVGDLMVSEQNVVSEERNTCEEPEVFIPRRSERLWLRPPSTCSFRVCGNPYAVHIYADSNTCVLLVALA
ncbi:hypothetical protein T265_13421, partial [Opisthorchis viverrini]